MTDGNLPQCGYVEKCSLGGHSAPLEGTYSMLRKKFQEEVTSYWVTHFETSSRAILKPEYASNPAVHRPYKWAHLDPATIDGAIAEIWSNAKPWPRHFYDRGHSEDRRVYNWVLKWLLWHVCRYRDWRNRKGKSSNGGSKSGNGSGSNNGSFAP